MSWRGGSLDLGLYSLNTILPNAQPSISNFPPIKSYALPTNTSSIVLLRPPISSHVPDNMLVPLENMYYDMLYK